ncbi:winged helix-turn-helix domain-containing protein [Micropruina sonneratiae]|uniref:winged helix-turn-helix domain-containing protein n=1 Tax=Micropruina sonneratiae TaxID=2986940 RepID=UPI002227DC90|nr:winged helix-turn-helix domain-containing protein [Micropruina sp. KQZ13P-5]MCW3158767.1 winged helix-turn-helix domain-containing protein [Micropruina sp. KQZ13P-5]
MPDYELDDQLALTDPGQYRALFEETRREIVSVLLERAATTSELADVLGKPKGTIGHHLKVLAEAGLVRVVRTKRVRALEAKYYGRTARVFWYDRAHEAVGDEARVLATAASQITTAPDEGVVKAANVRHARIPLERAHEWQRRMQELLLEFMAEPPAGDLTYALVFGLYPTPRPPLPDEADE